MRIRPAPAPAASGNPGFGPLGDPRIGFFQTPFLWGFEKLEPGKGGHFQNLFLLRKFENGTRAFFKNLKFSKFHVPAIQKMLILS